MLSDDEKEDFVEVLVDEFVAKGESFKDVVDENVHAFEPLELYTQTIEFFSESRNVDRCIYELTHAHIFFDKTIAEFSAE